ncbi:SDR family oxidoreductase [Methylogaea oryzae]|uniref:SDR family oxidoreductase n=1 Tax=Methylogaea oryzae TaxID=1295382 RepID=UPI000ADF6697|nr:SDR family oxidoreductase [Methylogaea oryzae]
MGLEFCRQYAEAGWRVLAACRDPDNSKALHGLAKRHGGLEIHALDVADHAAIDRLAEELRGRAVDVLLNNAGVYGDNDQNDFGSMDYGLWEQVLRINTLGPVKMAEAFLPHVLRGERKLVVAVTSLMGSMADNSSGHSLMYRSSKAALNAAVRSLALDLRPRGVGFLLVHPGWVQTDMGGANAPLQAEESVRGMRQQVEHFDLRHSGEFVNYLGKPLAW